MIAALYRSWRGNSRRDWLSSGSVLNRQGRQERQGHAIGELNHNGTTSTTGMLEFEGTANHANLRE
jgi:hypothetical protein